MKVFLSHNMSGLSERDIIKIRNDALGYLQSKYDEPIELIDNYHHENVPEEAGPLWHLGTSITQMEEADAIYFCPGISEHRGCSVERLVASLYGLRVLNREL